MSENKYKEAVVTCMYPSYSRIRSFFAETIYEGFPYILIKNWNLKVFLLT